MSRQNKIQTHIRALLADIFEAAWDEDICGFKTINQLADHADLSWATVDNLWQQCCRASEGTKEPRYSTILKLARAVHMDLTLAKEALEKPVVTKRKRQLVEA